MENTVEQDRPQMTTGRMRIACWIPKATNRHSEYVVRIASPLQQWSHERTTMLRYTCTACLGVHKMYGFPSQGFRDMKRYKTTVTLNYYLNTQSVPRGKHTPSRL